VAQASACANREANRPMKHTGKMPVPRRIYE
jgi:hypothetical protein